MTVVTAGGNALPNPSALLSGGDDACRLQVTRELAPRTQRSEPPGEPSGPDGPLIGAALGRILDIITAHPREALMNVLYLGISGVLHPSASFYKMCFGRSPSDDGHHEYEAVPVLERALEGWPDVRMVLTSTQPWAHGLPFVLEKMGPSLASRVDGFTYEDLTVRLRRGHRQLPLSNEDYWRLMKADIVKTHVEWLKPSAWVAVDDETTLWADEDRELRLVDVDGRKGLLDSKAQDRLLTLLWGNFGAPSVRSAAAPGLTS
jgi:hypothetical protein